MSYHGTPVVVIEIPEGSWVSWGQTIDTGKISKLIGATQGIKRLAEARRSGGMPTATIIGSGPNGLSAAIVLAASGVRTTVLEPNGQIGGGCSTAEVTQPGFFTTWALRHTLWALQALSMVLYPSPFLGLNRTRHSLTHWMTGPRSCLNTRLKKQRTNWMHVTAKNDRSLIEPIVSNFAALVEEILGPILHIVTDLIRLAGRILETRLR